MSNKTHFHKCPVPVCGHIWEHSEPREGWRNSAHFHDEHTCPQCKVGKELYKCDANGTPNLVNDISLYEAGLLDERDTIDFFQGLVNSGLAWKLQGHYGRTARALIGQGLVTEYR